MTQRTVSPGRVAVLLMGVAIALRAFAWQHTAVIFNDGPRFLRQAEAILAGRWGEAFAEPYHPLYALLTAALSWFGPSVENAAAWVSIVAGGAAVAVLYAFLRDAFGAPYDWLGAFLFATHSRAVQFSADVQSEGLFFLTFLAAVALAWRTLDRGSWRYAFAAGMASTLAYWTRPEGLLVGLCALALAPYWAWRRGWSLGRWLRSSAALGLAMALGVGAYVGVVEGATGSLRLTQKKALPELAGDPSPSQSSAIVPGPPEAVPVIPVAPKVRRLRPRKAKSLGPALEDLWYTLRSGARPLILVGLLCALPLLRRPQLRGVWLIALASGYFALLLWLLLSAGYVSRRHVLPPLLPLFGYAAIGLCTVWNLIQRYSPRPEWSRKTAPVALAAILLLPLDTEPRRIEKMAERRAAEWLATVPVAAPGEAVAGVGGRVGYYAERPMLDLRSVDASELAAAIEAERARFAIFDEPVSVAALEASPAFVEIHRVEVAGVQAHVFERNATGSE